MFKKGFLWGVGSAAFQVEGAANEDGKGPSNWDMHCKESGNISYGHSGDTACDQYHRYREDAALMKELGIKAYRFSISWPRIIPSGIGDTNPKGIEYYNSLITELIKNGIEPVITLFHWDLPAPLQEKGGFLNNEISDWFEYFAAVIADNFGDRVKYFITINEPQSFLGGYFSTSHPPKEKHTMGEMAVAVHNVLLCHGKAARVIRERVTDAKIGYAPCGSYFYPLDENNKKDIEAARELTFAPNRADINGTHWCISGYSDPIYLGCYPEEYLEYYEKYLPAGWQEDLKIIHQPTDFCGMNIYTGSAVTTDSSGKPYAVPKKPGHDIAANIWGFVTPPAIKWGAIFNYERYKKPIIITENGFCNADVIFMDGKVHDPQRIDYTHRHLLQLKEATDAGVDVAGYFHWTFLDNMEWQAGYTQRFGLVHVDFETQKRTPKDSAYWYKAVIKANGENL